MAHAPLRVVITAGLALSMLGSALVLGLGGPGAGVTPDPGAPDIAGFLGAVGEPPKAQPGDWMYWQRFGSAEAVDPGAYARSLRQARVVERMTAAEAPVLAEAEWAHLGPVNIGGRVVDLAVDPNQPNTVYAASASGGVWKSTDAGLTFERAWPNNLTQSLGALAIGSDGTLYAGTGEPNPGGGSIVYGGTGLYRSTDGGKKWTNVGLKKSGAIGRIVVDPSNPKRVFAAAAGDLFAPGGERGLYRSLDGGKTWKRVLQGSNGTTGAADVAINPDDPKVILAGMWDHRRLPTHRVYAGAGSGVYRSTDGGDSWTRAKEVGAAAPEETGRIGVSFAASDPNVAYAVVANKLDGTGVGLFRSDDGGESWANTGASPGSLSQSSYGWWFGRVWVDPLNADRLFVGGVEVVESVDGGKTFVAQTNTLVGVGTGAFQAGPAVHADQHAMVWDPGVPGRVYLGNDGGVYRSDANGTAETWVAGVRQGWTQHYSVDVSEQNPSRVVSGMQDNLCQRNYVGGDLGRPDTWTKYGLCGDGLQTLINPEDDNIVYGCAQYGGNCSKTLDGGVAFTFLGGTQSQRRGWWVPVQFDPTDPNVMYYGGNILNRSTDGGSTWEAISPDLTTNPEQLDPNPGYRIYGTITTVAAAPSDPKVVYVGTDDALLWRTTDLGKHWQRLDQNLPNLWVTRVAVDPKDADTAYVSYSGYRNASDAPHVVKTTDGGRTWKDISGNLPQAPVTEIVIVGKSIAVGTDVGVFVASANSNKWFSLGNNLPTIPVLDLRYQVSTNTLTAATFGHGIQRVELPKGL
ncbi:MAG: WD40/YVTN/BNR-like repeat-containing protein [Actinomycetota bacterium]